MTSLRARLAVGFPADVKEAIISQARLALGALEAVFMVKDPISVEELAGHYGLLALGAYLGEALLVAVGAEDLAILRRELVTSQVDAAALAVEARPVPGLTIVLDAAFDQDLFPAAWTLGLGVHYLTPLADAFTVVPLNECLGSQCAPALVADEAGIMVDAVLELCLQLTAFERTLK